MSKFRLGIFGSFWVHRPRHGVGGRIKGSLGIVRIGNAFCATGDLQAPLRRLLIVGFTGRGTPQSDRNACTLGWKGSTACAFLTSSVDLHLHPPLLGAAGKTRVGLSSWELYLKS